MSKNQVIPQWMVCPGCSSEKVDFIEIYQPAIITWEWRNGELNQAREFSSPGLESVTAQCAECKREWPVDLDEWLPAVDRAVAKEVEFARALKKVRYAVPDPLPTPKSAAF